MTLWVEISEFDQKFVRPRWEPDDDEGFTACTQPVPGSIINGDVQMSDSWGNIQSGP